MVRTRSWRTSSMLLKPSSSSRRRFCSAAFASVFEVVLLDSRTRLAANQNSYHQTFPLLNSDIDWGPGSAESLHCPELAGRSAVLDPPVGNTASHASISSGRYRTREPTLINCGPRRSSLH